MHVSNKSAGLEDDVLTTDIIAEEEKLELANDEQEKAWRKEVQDRAKEEEELKEKRYWLWNYLRFCISFINYMFSFSLCYFIIKAYMTLLMVLHTYILDFLLDYDYVLELIASLTSRVFS